MVGAVTFFQLHGQRVEPTNPHCVGAIEREAGINPASRDSDGRSAQRHDPVVGYPHVVAGSDVGKVALVDDDAAAIIHFQEHVVRGCGFDVLLDRIAGHGATNGTGHSGCGPTVALADLIAQHTADDTAEYRAAAAGRAVAIHRFDAFDHAAVVAAYILAGSARGRAIAIT